ncbi:MAG TPA: PP2C family protein-serine/threonine phosphatase [Solirubrobacteraceae bacterium]
MAGAANRRVRALCALPRSLDARRQSAARRVLTPLAVVCGVFALQGLPSASAAKGGSASPGAGAGEAAAQGARRAERLARAEGAPPPPLAPPSVEAPAPPPVAAHGHHSQPAPSAPPAMQGGSTHPRNERRPSGAVHGRRGEQQVEQTTSASSVAAPSAQAIAQQVEALARKQKKGGGSQKGKKEHKGKKGDPAPEEEATATEGSSAEGSGAVNLKQGEAHVAAPAQAAVAAASTLLTSPTATPASGTSSTAVSSLPVAEVTASAAQKAGRQAAAHRAHRTPSHAPNAVALAGAAVVAPVTQGGAAASPSSSPRSAKPTHHESTQPALVKTFTKIVGVVPTPVRALIGALILLALLLGARSLFSGVRTRRLVRQRGQLLEDVGLLQAALLPVPPKRIGPVASTVAYRPADGPGAGGDFYDVFALENGEIAVIVGDVSGHGREALPHTALLRFTVRAYLEAGLSPRKALQTAGSVLDRQLAGSFATVVAATYNPRERRLTYAAAGHPPPVMLGEHQAHAAPTTTSCSAPPIGAGMPTGTRQTVVSVPGPAQLCFHTDGVTEARVAGELFGAERLAQALAGLERDADAAALLARVSECTDARPDDMAACLLRVHDGEHDSAPVVVLEQLELTRELLDGTRFERFLRDCSVSPADAAAIAQAARERLQRSDTPLLLELVPSGPGRATVTLHEDNVIHAAALAKAGVS